MQDNNKEATAQNKGYVLRILSGPHMGAEVPLPQDKKLLLGKGENCDVVLKDDKLADQHALFSFQEDHFVCAPGENAEITIDGEVIQEAKALKNFAAIVCGTTLMSIGPNDVVWPNIQPYEPKDIPGKDVAPTTANEEKKAEKAFKNVFTSEKLKWLKEKVGLALLFIGLVVILVMILKPGENKEEQKHEEKTQFPIVALKKSIESVLNKNNVDAKFINIALSGKNFTLQCYVSSGDEKTVLEKQLRGLPNVNFQSLRIYVQASFVEQAQIILNPYLTVTATPGAELDGLTLKGYLFNIDQLPKIKSDLFRDIRGLNKIDTVLLSADEAFDLASNLLTQYKLMGLLKVQPIRTGVMITGHIPASSEANWKQAQKAIKQAFQDACKVLSYVAVVAPQAVKKLFFPSEITTVAVPQNDKPWIELKSGDRYFEGALLPSGYTIQTISTEGIGIQKNEESIFFALSEL